jgi:hypothetical protein
MAGELAGKVALLAGGSAGNMINRNAMLFEMRAAFDRGEIQ